MGQVMRLIGIWLVAYALATIIGELVWAVRAVFG